MTSLNFRSLDLNLLRVFDEVMAERSLARAAHSSLTSRQSATPPAPARRAGGRAGGTQWPWCGAYAPRAGAVATGA